MLAAQTAKRSSRAAKLLAPCAPTFVAAGALMVRYRALPEACGTCLSIRRSIAVQLQE